MSALLGGVLASGLLGSAPIDTGAASLSTGLATPPPVGHALPLPTRRP